MEKERFFQKVMGLMEESGIEISEETNSLEADSIRYIALICALEEEFDLELPEEFLAFNALQSADQFLESLYEIVIKD